MPTKKVIILCGYGQSNEEGNESNTSLPAVYKERRSDIKMWQGIGTNFVDLQQTTNTYPNINTGLHASEFSRAWVMCNGFSKDILCVKHAVGGTSMTDYWHVGGALYNDFKTTLQDAIDYVENTLGYEYRIVVVMNQGEHDSNDSTRAANYQTLYAAQLADLFSNFDISAYLCTQTRSNIGGAPFSFTSTVRTAQSNVISSYSGNSFPVGIIDPSDLNPGDLHFGEPGYTTLGQRQAQWFLDNAPGIFN